MVFQRRAHFLTEFARPLAMDNADERHPGQVGFVEIVFKHQQGIFGALSAQIQFQAGRGRPESYRSPRRLQVGRHFLNSTCAPFSGFIGLWSIVLGRFSPDLAQFGADAQAADLNFSFRLAQGGDDPFGA